MFKNLIGKMVIFMTITWTLLYGEVLVILYSVLNLLARNIPLKDHLMAIAIGFLVPLGLLGMLFLLFYSFFKSLDRDKKNATP